MTEQDESQNHAAELRRQAEERLSKQLAPSTGSGQALDAGTPEEAGRLLLEFQIHQIELKIQNEELRRAQQELEASRARYFDLYNLAPVGYVTVSEPGLILEANLTAANLLGVDRNALVKQPLTRFIVPDDQDIHYRHRQQLFKTGTPQVCELRLVKKDGSQFWVRLEAAPAQDTDGEPVYRVVLSDITDRKQAEKNLRFQAQLLEAVEQAVIATDLNGRIVYWNPYAEKLYGWTAAEAMGQTTLQLISSEEALQYGAEIMARLQKGESWSGEYLVRRRDGTAFTAQVTNSPIYDENKMLIGIVGISADITARKQAEQDLKQYKQIVSSTLDGIAFLSKDYRYRIVNKAYESFSGKKQEEFIGLTVAEYLGAETFETNIKPHFERCLQGETVNYREWFDYPTLGRRFVEVTYYPYLDEHNQITGIVANTKDITEQRQAQQEIERLADVVNHMPVGLHLYHLEDMADDRTLRMVAANPATAKSTGVAVEDVLGRTIDENFPDLRRLGLPQLYAGVVRSGQVLELGEVEYGDVRVEHGIFSVTAFPLPQNHVGIIFENITERKHMEQSLRESEKKYRSLYASMTEGVALHEILYNEQGQAIDYVVLDVNPAYELITRLAKQEAVGRKASEIYQTGEPPYLEIYALVAASGEPTSFETYFPPLQKYFNISVFSPGQGKFASVFEDITERKQAEEALRESETSLKFSQQVAHVGHWTWDTVANRVVWSDEMYRIFGLDPATFDGDLDKVIMQAIHPDDREKVIASNNAVLTEQRPAPMEYRVIWPDQSVHTIWAKPAKNVTNAKGEILKLSRIVQDITESKHAEEQIKASLREKEVMLQEIHHRVKNNLQVVSSLLDMQADTIENPRVLQALQDSQQRIRSMALVHEKLYQSKDLAHIDFADYIEDMVDYLLMMHGDQAGHVMPRLEVAENFLTIDMAIPCGLILNELVSNAMKHAFAEERGEAAEERGAAGGTTEIRITFKAQDGEYLLVVGDNGIGLPPEVDIDDSPSLGLQLVKILTRQLQGTLNIDRDAGTTFTISFPETKPARGERT